MPDKSLLDSGCQCPAAGMEVLEEDWGRKYRLRSEEKSNSKGKKTIHDPQKSQMNLALGRYPRRWTSEASVQKNERKSATK